MWALRAMIASAATAACAGCWILSGADDLYIVDAPDAGSAASSTASSGTGGTPCTLPPGDAALVQRSFVSPGHASGALAVARPFDAWIASVEPATIYYTTDGTEPTRTSPSAQNLVVLPIDADTVVRFFADGESTVHEMAYTIDASLQGDAGTVVEHVQLGAAATPVTVQSPGEAIDGHADWQHWNGPCPTCIQQLLVGVADPSSCLNDYAGIGPWPGQNGVATPFVLTAPCAHATYEVHARYSDWLSCDEAKAKEKLSVEDVEVGLIVVR
jgi:hypothetical protein